MQVSKEPDKNVDFIALTRKNNRTFKRTLFHNVWRIFFIYDRINTYNDAIYASFQRNGSNMQTSLHKREKQIAKKILRGPFSNNAWQIFVIFDRVNRYNDTNNLCKFKKSDKKY